MGLVSTVLRVLQFLFTLIATGLIGNVRATTISAAGTSTAAINFAIFVLALSWLALLYGLVIQFVSAIAIPVVSLVLDSLATLFTFIAAVILSAKLTSVNCGNYGSKHSGWIAYGSGDTEKRCREIQAGLVFMWFLFATFAATLFFTYREFRRGGGSVRGPNMSQIGV
ncbi:marvel domain-containing protein [Poronia punctata]|nr:marvel domain-containing protein [Poronia punctata]